MLRRLKKSFLIINEKEKENVRKTLVHKSKVARLYSY